MSIKVGINGFGRIGRQVLRICENNPEIDVVAINSRSSTESHAHLLKYDSSYGIFEKDVSVKNDNLRLDGREIKVFRVNDPAEIPWDEAGADIVLESTGAFRKRDDAAKHLRGSVKKVIISAPGKKVDGSFVMGVNEETYDNDKHHVFDNASCTTNCLAPVAKVLNDNFGIEKGLLTTVHAFTNDQNILDNSHKKDQRRARTATSSIIPTSTGAAKAVGLVIPELKGKLDGLALRIPTPTVSIVDLVAIVKKPTTIEEVNNAFDQAVKGTLGKYMSVSYEPLVSIDFKGSHYSSIVDALSTNVMDGNLVKVLAWYDNEWGYSCRLVDLAVYIGLKI